MNSEKIKLLIKLVIFTLDGDKLKVFFPKKILPACNLNINGSLDQTAKRLFNSYLTTRINDYYFEQLYTVSEREKREIRVNVVYYLLIAKNNLIRPLDNNWISANQLEKRGGDEEIIKYALQRLRWKIEYTNVVYSLLPEEFTFGQLQTVYEAILDKILDKRNFRKKILSLNILRHTGKIRKTGQSRPAEIFSFRKRQFELVEIL